MPAIDRSMVHRFLSVLRHNWLRIGVDLILLTAWLVLGTEFLRLLGIPRWLQYLVLFGGVIVYVYLTTPWEHPGDARSDEPDQR